MKVTKIRASVGATINLGNFESLKIQHDLEADLEEGDAIMESMDVLRNALVEKIREDLGATAGGKKYLSTKL